MPYSPSQIFAALTNQGVPPQDAATLTQISGAESGYGAKVVGPVNSNGSVDYGVFQINNAAWPQFGGAGLATAPLDQQAAAAAQVYAKQGLGAWTTYKTGAYQHFASGAGPAGAGGSLAQGPIDNAAGSTPATPPVAGDIVGAASSLFGQAVDLQGLGSTAVSQIGQLLSSLWNGSIFANSLDWVTRGFLIIVGLVIAALGVWRLLAPDIKSTITEVAKAAPAALAAA